MIQRDAEGDAPDRLADLVLADLVANADRLAELVLSLNDWIASGGFLPTDWVQS